MLDRAGSVVARQRFDQLPVRLGRAYDNDVIVDDPFVAPSHVQIERREDGVLVARDLGTRNGTHAVAKLRRGSRKGAATPSGEIVLTPDTLVRAGHSTFRVRPIDHVVAAERVDTTSHGWEGLRPAILAIVMLTLLALFNAWSADTSTQDRMVYETGVAAVLGIMLVWAGLWALLNRLFAGRARFGRHLWIGAVCAVASFVTSSIAAMLGYAFSLSWLTQLDSYFSLGLLSVAIYYHVATITPLSPSFARRFAVAFALLAVGLFGLWQYSTEHRLSDSLYMSSLQWPALRMVAPVSTEEFVKDIAALKARADLRRNDFEGGED